MKSRELTQCALLFAFLVICSKISLPIGVIPISFQTLAVVLLGLILSTKQILFVFTAYILGGLCGLPIFANGGGFSYILQPSFGFILSFPIAALCLSQVRKVGKFQWIPMWILSLFALCIIYLGGILYMGGIFRYVLLIEKNVFDLLAVGVLPFVLQDVVSIGLASFIATHIFQREHVLKKVS